LEQLKDFINKDQVFISLSKGLEELTLLLPTQIIESVLENKNKVFALSGPNFAHEIIEKKITASVLAGFDEFYSLKIYNDLKNNYFKLETSKDILGVQVGGALKNVISLLAGMLTGYELGKNTISYFITKAFDDASRLINFMGGRQETIYGLSGFGDLYLSSTSPFGKNFMFGCQIGKLLQSATFDKELFFKDKLLPEGLNTIVPLHELIIKSNLDLYYLDLDYKIIFEGHKFNLEQK
jgi:glycerol-3-phosphate dehydrogenase (NAD(P)+)